MDGPHRRAVLDYLGPIVGEMPAGHRFPTLADYRAQAGASLRPLHTGMLVGMGTLRGCAAAFTPVR